MLGHAWTPLGAGSGNLLPEVLLWWDGMKQPPGMNYHPAAADDSKTSMVTLP